MALFRRCSNCGSSVLIEYWEEHKKACGVTEGQVEVDKKLAAVCVHIGYNLHNVVDGLEEVIKRRDKYEAIMGLLAIDRHIGGALVCGAKVVFDEERWRDLIREIIDEDWEGALISYREFKKSLEVKVGGA